MHDTWQQTNRIHETERVEVICPEATPHPHQQKKPQKTKPAPTAGLCLKRTDCYATKIVHQDLTEMLLLWLKQTTKQNNNPVLVKKYQ